MNLKEERKRRCLSQKELAAGAGVAVKTVADIERGTVEGAGSTWRRLEAFLAAPPTPERLPEAERTHDPGAGEDFAWHREQEGLSRAAMAKLMGCQRSEIDALEAGELRLMPLAWETLERFKDGQHFGLLTEGPCGFCGKKHLTGRCP